jgi:phosphinothricin acetyltransferase
MPQRATTIAEPVIRIATTDDLPEITRIYNHYVPRSTCTYQEQPDTLTARRHWFDRHSERHPITVAILEGKLVGWGSLSPFHSRSAFRYTVENSVYVDEAFLRRGIGRRLLRDLITRAASIGHHAIIAAVDAEQIPSIRLHEALGFERVGEFPQVGFKFERWLTAVYLQLLLPPQEQRQQALTKSI